MTTAQVESYIAQAHAWGIPHLYSINRDHSPNNPELTRVSSILSAYYQVMFDEPSLEVKPAVRGFSPGSIFARAKILVKKAVSSQKENPHTYRHMIGMLR